MEDQGLTPVVPGIRLLLCAVCSGQSVVSVLDAGSPSRRRLCRVFRGALRVLPEARAGLHFCNFVGFGDVNI